MRSYLVYARWARNTAQRWAERRPLLGVAAAVAVALAAWDAMRWAARHLP